MSQPFYSDAKNVLLLFFFFVTLYISTRFLRNYGRHRLINTPLELLRPADVPFGGFVDIAPHFGGEIPGHLTVYCITTDRYEGCLINKLQNGAVSLIFKISKSKTHVM